MWSNGLMKTFTDPATIDDDEFAMRLSAVVSKLIPEHAPMKNMNLLELDTKQLTLTLMTHRPPLSDNDTVEESMTWWAYQFIISCLKYAGWVAPLAEFYLRRAECAIRFME